MRRTFGFIAAIAVVMMLASCGEESPYPGFKKMDNGAYMKFYNKGGSDVTPRLGDEVTIEMAQYFNDSLLFSTADDKPMSLVLTEPDFKGDVVDGLLMMHVGDSARLLVPADSVLTILLQMEEVPEEYVGKPIFYDLKLISVKPSEELEAEHMALLDSLKREEEAYLKPLHDDANNKLTESGLVIMELSGKGKTAQMGDYVNFDFTVCTAQGDTIMNSFGVEPVEMQYGEEFIGEGVTEAIGMVPEGGMMRFVVPSSLAFDSVGYEEFILPYTPLVMRLKMNKVMDKETYEKHKAAEEAKQAAEKERLKNKESQAIADYIKSNSITEQPTESGLYILNREEGEGNVAQWGDEVAVHYVLRNLKGEPIESSYDYGRPMVFTVGGGEMIHAIDEALMTMAPGAKVTLLTPSELAFGEFILGESLPPYSPLIIDLELVEIK